MVCVEGRRGGEAGVCLRSSQGLQEMWDRALPAFSPPPPSFCPLSPILCGYDLICAELGPPPPPSPPSPSRPPSSSLQV